MWHSCGGLTEAFHWHIFHLLIIMQWKTEQNSLLSDTPSPHRQELCPNSGLQERWEGKIVLARFLAHPTTEILQTSPLFSAAQWSQMFRTQDFTWMTAVHEDRVTEVRDHLLRAWTLSQHPHAPAPNVGTQLFPTVTFWKQFLKILGYYSSSIFTNNEERPAREAGTKFCKWSICIKILRALHTNTSGCAYSLKVKKQSNPLRKQSICIILAWVGTQESEVIADFTLV